MSRDRNLYNNLITSLFPSIHGNNEVKRGVLLMLFGGVAKTTIEGTNTFIYTTYKPLYQYISNYTTNY